MTGLREELALDLCQERERGTVSCGPCWDVADRVAPRVEARITRAVAAERERCARLVEEIGRRNNGSFAYDHAASAIRAQTDKP
jgi:hypothetical protein